MNEIQQKAFEMLELFVAICEKWDIEYYLLCGSALGAVKYQGFIPWDDDIDVGMLRKDYDRFLEIAPKELPEWCFLQNYKTEPSFTQSYTKLRNSNTTFLEKDVEKLNINHGIYIDVFPLDGHPKRKVDKLFFEMQHKLYTWMRVCALDNSASRKVQMRNKFFRLLGCHKATAQVQKKLEALYPKYPPETSELWCNYGNWQGNLEYAPSWHYGEGTWATFEGLRVRIPEAYDAYLTQKYGDWRAELPPEQQRSHHNYVVCDTERPYTYYLSKL